MKKGINKPRYIIADDFTGANDIGVALASSGVATKVLLATTSMNSHDAHTNVGVICTNSRDLEQNEAKQTLESISTNYLLTENQPLLIKKIDSTLRGNVGSEIEALLNTGYTLTIVAIAAPLAGRKTVGGLCYVNDVPLSDTEFASDPKSPIHSSRIKDIIETQTTLETVEYLYSDQKSEPHEHSFVRLYDSGAKIIVCDTQTNDELFDLYHATSRLNIPTVFVTTGELTHSLINSDRALTSKVEPSKQPVLAIVGSMSEMTLQQSQYLLDHNEAIAIDLDLESLLSENEKHYIFAKAAEASELLSSGKNCIIRSCTDLKLRHQLKTVSAQYGLTQKQLAEHVRECLSELAFQIITKAGQQIGGMILCGGDIAIATAQRLNASTYQIGGIVAECVPWGMLESQATSFPIFTKAGGFGNPSTFSQVIQQLHKEVS